MKIELPYNFKPRDYQKPLWDAIINKDIKRAISNTHRRAGKDLLCMNIIATKMFERVGSYYHFLPTYNQGRKIIWNGMTKEGVKFTDYIPEALRSKTKDQEMMIETKNGSIYQVVGTDEVNRIVGTNPVGCVFSEYALQDPRAWDYIRPILAENNGWAIFISTPRGENHFFNLYETAKQSSEWFVETIRAEDTHAIPQEILDQEKAEIFQQHGDYSLYEQEYNCSFSAPITGAYYAKLLDRAKEEKRLTSVPYDTSVLVNTAWDIGIGDQTAIWFYQIVGKEIHIIDHYQASGEALQHYIKYVREKDYVYDSHYAPHDMKARELGTGKSRWELAKGLGINFKIVPNISVDDGIDAVRSMLNRCWFDTEKCKRGLECLRNYRKDYDDKNKIFRSFPLHDWTSDSADSFRMLAVSLREKVRAEKKKHEPNFRPINPITGY